MAIYVYNSKDGSLYSWCPNDTDQVASNSVLASKGLASVKGLPPLSDTIGWDPVGKTTQTVIPVVKVPLPATGTITVNGVTYNITASST